MRKNFLHVKKNVKKMQEIFSGKNYIKNSKARPVRDGLSRGGYGMGIKQV